MRDEGRAAETALPLPGLAVQDVLLERLAPQKLPVLGPLEALGCAAVCLQLDLFRHLPLTLNHALRQAQDERSETSSKANVAANEASSFRSASSAVALSRCRCRGGLGFAAAALRPAREDGVHLVALHPRRRFGHGHVGQLLDQTLENAPPDLGMRHLAAAEEDRRLDLVAVFEEALDVLLLELVVVLVDFRAEFDLLDLDHLLVLAGLARALLLLVLVLPEIHDAADRRHGRRRDLDQVEPLLLGDREGLWRRHDAELRAGVVDHPDFADPAAFVHSGAVVAAWTSVESDKASLRGYPVRSAGRRELRGAV